MRCSGKSALVTGGAGFIGSHLVDSLLSDGWYVTIVDNFDSFYNPLLKRANIQSHLSNRNCKLIDIDLCNLPALHEQLAGAYDVIVHLAAKAGVRPSIHDPVSYQVVNVQGTQNMLELAKTLGTQQFVFGSSSSVYGINPDVPWNEEDHVLRPISPYASTKVSGELMGHVYSHLYGIRFTALRFFTVYGPRQRPDLAIHKFVKLLMEGKPIPVYGDGSTRRDYTYVLDIVQGIRKAMNIGDSVFEIINLGNDQTIGLGEMISVLEEVFEKKAIRKYLPEQPGDVPCTWADITKAKKLLGYQPQMQFKRGISEFAKWFEELSVVTHSTST